MEQKQRLEGRLEQKLIITQEMQLALSVLRMPLSQLSDWIEDEVAENPEIEFSESHISKAGNRTVVLPSNEQILTAELSLYEELRNQVLLDFPQDIDIAEKILGNINDKGFLDVPIEEIAPHTPIEEVERVLHKIQRLEPVGIGAKDVQEALLIQLLEKGKVGSKAFRIVDQYYEPLIHSRYKHISTKLRISEEALKILIAKEITPLDPFPGRGFSNCQNPSVSPECEILFEKNTWKIRYRGEDYPSITLKESENKSDVGLKQNRAKGKWLIHTLWERKKTLETIIFLIIDAQSDYLLEKEKAPSPMTLTDAAKKTEVHLSTFSRAIQGKYIETPLGLLPLSHFFSKSVGKEQTSDISIEKAKILLKELINTEDKKCPYPDQLLAKLLKQKGVLCSRRTITKYRLKLGIPSTHQRQSH